MNVSEIADSIDEIAAKVADRIKSDKIEAGSLYARLARANEQVVLTIQSALLIPGIERAKIDKLTADLHGATIAVEHYDARSKAVKADAIAKSIASAQARTVESGNKKITAAIAAIEIALDDREISLPDPSDGKYNFYELTTGVSFWLEVGGKSPNCIWQLPGQVPYRSGNLSEVCCDGEAIYGCNCSVQPETFWQSIDGASWEQIDEDIYRKAEKIELAWAIEVGADKTTITPIPDFNFVPTQVAWEDPSYKREPPELASTIAHYKETDR